MGLRPSHKIETYELRSLNFQAVDFGCGDVAVPGRFLYFFVISSGNIVVGFLAKIVMSGRNYVAFRIAKSRVGAVWSLAFESLGFIFDVPSAFQTNLCEAVSRDQLVRTK